MKLYVLIFQGLYHSLVAAGNIIFIAGLTGCCKKRLPAVPGHAAPAQSYSIALGTQFQLRIGRNGIIGMGPVFFRMELFIDPQQHSGSLSPGGGGIRSKCSSRSALGHADIVSNGNIALAPCYIRERQRSSFFHSRCCTF